MCVSKFFLYVRSGAVAKFLVVQRFLFLLVILYRTLPDLSRAFRQNRKFYTLCTKITESILCKSTNFRPSHSLPPALHLPSLSPPASCSASILSLACRFQGSPGKAPKGAGAAARSSRICANCPTFVRESILCADCQSALFASHSSSFSTKRWAWKFLCAFSLKLPWRHFPGADKRPLLL